LDLFQGGGSLYALSTLEISGFDSTTKEDNELPLYFFPNNGEVAANAEFYARTSEYTLLLTKAGLVFDGIDEEKKRFEGAQTGNHNEDLSRLLFLNANKDPDILTLENTRIKGVKAFRSLLYQDIYNNIDLKISGIEKQIEYTWIVKPGGNPGDIRFEYKNVKATSIDNRWDLAIETRYGTLIHKKPVSYQLIDGEKIDINSHYEPIKENTYGFMIKAFDREYALIIDPLVKFELSTQ